MEVSTEKSKTMVNSANTDHAKIHMNGSLLEDVSTFKYLGATLNKDGTCTAEINSRIGAATSAMTKLPSFYKTQIAQVSGSLDHVLWLRDIDTNGCTKKENPGFSKQMLKEAPPNLLDGTQNQQLCMEQN